MLKTATCGFGGLALTGIHYGEAASINSLVPQTSLFPQRAKRVIFIFMAGGPAMWILLITNRNCLRKMESKLILLEFVQIPLGKQASGLDETFMEVQEIW